MISSTVATLLFALRVDDPWATLLPVAGPVLDRYYAFDEAPRRSQLADVLRRRGQLLRADAGVFEFAGQCKKGTSGLIHVGIRPARRFTDLRAHEREAFEATLGFVPAVELTAQCGVNGPADWECLRLLAGEVAKKFGGWSEFSGSEWDPVPAGEVRTVEICDLLGFFGPMLADRDYVRANLELVPVLRRYFVDAQTCSPASLVRK